jgi:hypothetical protein
MKKTLILALALTVSFTVGTSAWAQQKMLTVDESIQMVKTMQTAKQKADYLINQAKAFYSSKQFQQAVDLAKYVLSNIDKNSAGAKNILKDAEKQLAALAQQKVGDVKNAISGSAKTQ